MDTSQGSRPDLPAGAEDRNAENGPTSKRRCVSTACIACRRRKSKCDGNLPSCAACSSVYHTPCVYDPNSDHRRKGVYKKDNDAQRTKNATLLTLIQALLNYEEEDAFDLVRQIRSCDSLEDVAQAIVTQEKGNNNASEDIESAEGVGLVHSDQFESELAGKMSQVVLDGSRKFIGGTSNLIFLPPGSELNEFTSNIHGEDLDQAHNSSGLRWTRVTEDEQLISHLMTMYFTWHYPFFTILSRGPFYRDYMRGVSSQYCSSLLVNAMLSLGCHFSSWEGARDDPQNPATAGDHFFKEAKRLFFENDEHANAKLCTVQALALMSVREAGCGREGRGWVYSGMSFRMALDIGLNLDSPHLQAHNVDEEEADARRITFWGCFLIDKCWSNYLGRQPQLPTAHVSVPDIDVLPGEEAELWSPYTDSGASREHTQPSRTRAVALQIYKLCEVSGDLIMFFYDPTSKEKLPSKQGELKKLSEIHTRLEAWKKGLSKELEAKEGQLPQALLMHMLYQLLFIHLYRPFLKYTKTSSPLPQHVSPRKLCTQAASVISKLLRIYRRTYGLKQICNIAVYIAHTTCTIHLLNLPERNAQRDVVHGLRHLEEMGECWPCARRTLRILEISANKWHVQLPSEAVSIFEQTHAKWGSWGSWDQAFSPSSSDESPPTAINHHATIQSTLSSPGMPMSMNPDPNIPSSLHDLPTPSSLGPGPGPIPSHFPPDITVPSTLSSMREAHRSASAQLTRPNAPLPEPTYLRPVSHTYNSMPFIPFTQSQPDTWYNPNMQAAPQPSNEETVRGLTTAPGVAATPTTTSPVTGVFETSEPRSLVEESQWWARDPSTLGFGMGNWEV